MAATSGKTATIDDAAPRETIRVVAPRAYASVPTPAPDGGPIGQQEDPAGLASGGDGGSRPAARASRSAPAAESAGIINAIQTVYRVALAERERLLAELKALDDALAPFSTLSQNAPATPPNLSGDVLKDALLRFSAEHKGGGEM